MKKQELVSIKVTLSAERGEKEMTHEEKIQWMAMWAVKHNAQLVLEGECGLGRECVGLLVEGKYPDYEWYDADYERLDQNGDVWTPENAYHKHPCIAVLGRGEAAESQLYEWLQWFDAQGFSIETGDQEYDQNLGAIALLMGKHRFARMVRPQPNGETK